MSRNIVKTGLPLILCWAGLVYSQIALRVVSVAPEPNSIKVDPGSTIRAVFSAPLDSTTVGPSALAVYSRQTGRVPGQVSYDSLHQALLFAPQTVFPAGDQITVVLTNRLTGLQGERLRNGYSWQFMVRAAKGAFNFQAYPLITGMENSSLVACDLNADGITEVAVAGVQGGKNLIRFAQIAGRRFEPFAEVEIPSAVRPLYAADLDGNHVPDVIALHRKAYSFSVCPLDPSGRPGTVKTYVLPSPLIEPRSAAIGDLNGDGFLDVVIYGRITSNMSLFSLMVYLNDGRGGLGDRDAPSHSFYRVLKGEYALAADLNQDGWMDLSVTRSSSGLSFGYFLHSGDFLDFPNSPTMISGVSGDLEHALAADVDSDGQLDLITSDINTNQISVCLGKWSDTGQLTFAGPTLFPATPATNWMECSDVDADGDLDLATLGSKQNTFMLLSNDAGVFSVHNTFTPSSKPRQFTAADYNQDGSMDFLVLNQIDTLIILQNRNVPNHPPLAPPLLAPVNDAHQSSAVVRCVWRAPVDADGDSLHFRVELTRNQLTPVVYDSRTNPELFSPRPPVAPGIDSVALLLNLATEGVYRWNVQALDHADGGQVSETRHLIIDRTAPVLNRIDLLDAIVQNWINPMDTGAETSVQLTYTELYPDSAVLELIGIGQPQIKTSLTGGSLQSLVFKLPIDFLADGAHPLAVRLIDKSGLRSTLTSELRIDQTPPYGTLITTAQDTVSSLAIPVSIVPGNDGAGSGLSGVYRIQVSIDGGPWQVWVDRTTARDTIFYGAHLKDYAFEAAAFDRVGNFEGFQNRAETHVYVDTTSDDQTAPGKPTGVLANGANPSPWTRQETFSISWQLPHDESGIKTLFYKLGSAPQSNQDFSGSLAPQPPMQILLATEGSLPLYLWLMDGRNNVDYRNSAAVLLRRDTVSPLLHQATFRDAAFIDTLKVSWFNPRTAANVPVQLVYDEWHPARAEVFVDWLNRPITSTSLAAGNQVQTTLLLSTNGAQDRVYDLTFLIVDSTGNEGRLASRLAFDKTSPRGCVAFSPVSKSATEQFPVSWSRGEDGNGSGVSDRFDVYVSNNGGAWQKWLSDTPLTSSTFMGTHGRRYGFEAINKDRVGNVEPLLSVAETVVEVDTTLDDVTPPGAPLMLSAGGSPNASPWQTQPVFQITWQVPPDESGVVKSYYKLGSAPSSQSDTTGSSSAAGPLSITLAQEGQKSLFVWLKDRNGNVDYRNHAQVLLRYDKLPPKIVSVSTVRPAAVYTDTRPRAWYDPKKTSGCTLSITFSETQPESLIIGRPGLGPDIRVTDFTSDGPSQTFDVPLTWSGRADGRYTLSLRLRDAAARIDTTSFYLGLDSTPPLQIQAFASDTSSEAVFMVNWTTGIDAGSGLSGVYQVMVQENGAPWKVWLAQTTRSSESFQGRHGNTYRFEASGQDHMGLWEPVLGKAEAVVVVDTTADDRTAPSSPLNVRVRDAKGDAWQKNALFHILWDAPYDPSGLKLLFYKTGAAPAGNEDFSGAIPADSLLSVTLSKEGRTPVYLWLMDRRDNVDYRSAAMIMLGYDPAPPALTALTFTNAGYGANWFNPVLTSEASVRLRYSEKHADSLFLRAPQLDLNRSVANPNSGINIEFTFNIPISGRRDGAYLLTSTLIDSAGNAASRQDTLRVDQTAPTGVVASAQETSAARTFPVSWSAGQDDNGVGIAHVYDVWVNDNQTGWQNWLSRSRQRSALFTGEQGHRYEFEAIGYDLLQNGEPRLGRAECFTLIDTTVNDQTPPAAPLELTAWPDGWSTSPVFELSWKNPADASGIRGAYYKAGAPPTHAQDTTGSWRNKPPVTYVMLNEGSRTLYVWLEDGRGNADFKNNSSVTLRYDAAAPIIDSLYVQNAVYQGVWVNRFSAGEAIMRMQYSELFPDSLRIQLPGSMPPVSQAVSVAGSRRWLTAALPITGLNDGRYTVPVLLSDKAGQTAVDTLYLGVDGTAPQGSRALSPVVSISPEFEISWNGENAGSDGDGSGLSGEYDIRMRVDNGPWYLWQQRVRTTSLRYIGVHGHRYSFEIAAWDHVGLRELFADQAETVTLIDTAMVDRTAPDAPKNLMAGGAAPSPWQKSNLFLLTWENPQDPSSIARVFWKFDTAPTSQTDTSGTLAAVQPLPLTIRKTESQRVYLWLADGKGNVNYLNTASVVLRYDPVAPVIDSLRWVSPALLPDWFNQKKTGRLALLVHFHEDHPYQCTLSQPKLPEPVQIKSVPANGVLTTELKVINAVDGRYEVQVTLSDSAGNLSVAKTVSLGLDSTPPRIKHTAALTPVLENTPVGIQAVIHDENRIESASLQYGPAGSRFRTTLAMNRMDDSTFSATIPASALGARGLEYVLWSTDGLTLRREPALEQTPSSFSLRVRLVGANNIGLLRPTPPAAGTEVNRYQLVSFPIQIDDPRPEAVFEDDLGAYDKRKWRSFSWETATATLSEYPQLGRVEPGRSFWLITALPDVALDSGPGVSVAVHPPFVITLTKGWNDLANPYAFSVDWSDVFKATGADTQKVIGPYAYEGRWLLPFEVEQMNPWQGYSFYSDHDQAKLVIPALESAATLHKISAETAFKGADWLYHITARAAAAVDDNNYLGVASGDQPMAKYPEPYSVGDYVTLAFIDSSGRPWATDFRRPAEGYVWNIAVTTNQSEKTVQLHFHCSGQWPETLSAGLWDERDQVWINLKNDSVYYFISAKNNAVRRFQLLAGSSRFMAENSQSGMVTTTELLQNYPNPFNGQTVITYQVVKEGKVEIAIYNLLGQKIRVLYSGTQTAGRKQEIWDGRDEIGRIAASGVYLIKMNGPDFSAQRKMIFLR